VSAETDLTTKSLPDGDLPIIKPRALRKGNTVGIIAPSGTLFEESTVEFTYQWLQKLGLKWKVSKHLNDKYSDLAGCDEVRAAEFMNMWLDPEVDAILPVRGGNGAARLLPLIDFNAIRRHPKVFCGYSDITALLLSCYQMSGLVCFYGPMATTFYRSDYSFRWFCKALMCDRPLGLVGDPTPDKIWSPSYPPCRVVIAEGKARGPLTGGCLTLVRQLLGTPYAIETRGKIVFLEDLNEEPHSIDRFLTQLLLAGKLQQAAGILVAECINCRPGESSRRRLDLNWSVEAVLKDRLSNLGIPVVYGMRFGHGNDQLTLPLGALSTLEARGKTVKFKIEESGTHGGK
jgi:muramoyltetrapeptide carboxypeptidase